MAELLDQLKPIAEIIGPNAVHAYYSDHQLGDPSRGYRPGWKIEVDGAYRGAQLKFSTKAPTLDEAAAKALQQLREALGL